MYFSAYTSADLVLITKIDSLIIQKETPVKGKYTTILDINNTLIIKGKLNKPLVGNYNIGVVCGTYYKPELNKLRIIYARLVNNEYVFHESNCSRKIHYLDDLEDYRILKYSKNFKKYSDNDLNNRNKALHFLLNNIKLTNKVYNSFYSILPSQETSRKLNEIKVTKDSYAFYEVKFDQYGLIKKIKTLKKVNNSTDKEIKEIIKTGKWKTKHNPNIAKRKNKYIKLIKFDSYSSASNGSYSENTRKHSRKKNIQQENKRHKKSPYLGK